ncbi:tol-pal system-associated acyl-CoA thioesterase [Agaribacter flavus]|uniref:Tol-pal system-associated acyl-CoA thioesterase n=1 Tax=Agaribacter flavus TaxID=1902781 RepID=A0ABV7FNH3_9ALTE
MKSYTIEARVYFEDTDAGGIVYHANYLKYMERARTDWIRELGVSQKQLLEQSIAFVVKDISLAYKKSAKLDEMLTITCKPVKIGNASVNIEQQIYNNNDEILVSGSVKIACIDPYLQKPVKIPSNILREMRSDS